MADEVPVGRLVATLEGDSGDWEETLTAAAKQLEQLEEAANPTPYNALEKATGALAGAVEVLEEVAKEATTSAEGLGEAVRGVPAQQATAELKDMAKAAGAVERAYTEAAQAAAELAQAGEGGNPFQALGKTPGAAPEVVHGPNRPIATPQLAVPTLGGLSAQVIGMSSVWQGSTAAATEWGKATQAVLARVEREAGEAARALKELEGAAAGPEGAMVRLQMASAKVALALGGYLSSAASKVKTDLNKLGESAFTAAGALGGKLLAKLEPLRAKLEGAAEAAEKWDKLSSAMGNVATKLGMVAGGMGLLAGVGIKAASDTNEGLSAQEVAFGKNAAAMEEWVTQTAHAMGRGKGPVREAMTNFQLMLSTMLGSEKLATSVGQAFTKLSIDIGSLRNVSDEEALQAITSGVSGETEPLKRFGVVLTETALKSYLLEKGITASYEKMDEQSKAAVRASFILDRLKSAQGDAVATSDSFANQLKRIQGSAGDLASEFGQALLPAATSLLQALNSLVDWFKALGEGTKQWVAYGVAATGVVAGLGAAVLGIGSAILPAIAALKAMGLTWTVVSAAASTAWTAMLLPAIKVVAVVAGVAAVVAGVIAVVGLLRDAWDNATEETRDSVRNVGLFFKDMGKSLLNFFKTVLSGIIEVINITKDNMIDMVTIGIRGMGKLGGLLGKLGLQAGVDMEESITRTIASIKTKTTIDSDIDAQFEKIGKRLDDWTDGAARMYEKAKKTLTSAKEGLGDVGAYIGHVFNKGMVTVKGALGFGGSGEEGGVNGEAVRAQAGAEAGALSASLLQGTKELGGKALEAQRKAVGKLGEASAKAYADAAATSAGVSNALAESSESFAATFKVGLEEVARNALTIPGAEGIGANALEAFERVTSAQQALAEAVAEDAAMQERLTRAKATKQLLSSGDMEAAALATERVKLSVKNLEAAQKEAKEAGGAVSKFWRDMAGEMGKLAEASAKGAAEAYSTSVAVAERWASAQLQGMLEDAGGTTIGAQDTAAMREALSSVEQAQADLAAAMEENAAMQERLTRAKAEGIPLAEEELRYAEEAVNNVRSASKALEGASKYAEGTQKTFADTYKEIQEARAGLAGMVTQPLMSTGLGKVVEGATQGAALGGPVGAVGGAALALVSESAGFQELANVVGEVVQSVADGLGEPLRLLASAVGSLAGPILKLLTPAFELLGKLLKPVVAAVSFLGPILEGLAPLLDIVMQLNPIFAMMGVGLQLLAPVMKMVGVLLLGIVEAIGGVWNAVLSGVMFVLRGINDFIKFLGIGSMDGFIRQLEGLRFDTRATAESRRKLLAMDEDEAVASAEAAVADREQAEASREAREETSNIPQLFKLERRRAEAADPEDMSGGVGQGGGGSVSAPVGESEPTSVTYVINVNAENEIAAANEVTRRLEEREFRRSGNRYSRNGRWS